MSIVAAGGGGAGGTETIAGNLDSKGGAGGAGGAQGTTGGDGGQNGVSEPGGGGATPTQGGSAGECAQKQPRTGPGGGGGGGGVNGGGGGGVGNWFTAGGGGGAGSSTGPAGADITTRETGPMIDGNGNVGIEYSYRQDVVHTLTALSSSANPAGPGQAVTLTATVTPLTPGAPVPTGVVAFLDGTKVLDVAFLDSTGHATFTTTALGLGNHVLRAWYSGNANGDQFSVSPNLNQTIAAATRTSLATSATTLTSGQQFTVTATVTSSAAVTPTGWVVFYLDGQQQGAARPAPVGSSARANLVMSIRSPGKHSVTAIYQGDANTQSSTSNREDLLVQAADGCPC